MCYGKKGMIKIGMGRSYRGTVRTGLFKVLSE